MCTIFAAVTLKTPNFSGMKKHNFYAGPSILSEYTIKNTAEAILNFADTGLSVLEVSHRSKEFQAVIDEATALVKEILDIPEGFSVLWLLSIIHNSAHTQTPEQIS